MIKDIKKGMYGLHKGKEYKLYANENRSYNLISNNQKDIEEGFMEKYPDTYVKNVQRHEIGCVLQITPIAFYQSEKFDLLKLLNEDKVLLGTSSAISAERFGFYRMDKYYYSKEVLKNNITINKERKGLNF